MTDKYLLDVCVQLRHKDNNYYGQFCSELHDSESLIIMSCYRVYANIDKI